MSINMFQPIRDKYNQSEMNIDVSQPIRSDYLPAATIVLKKSSMAESAAPCSSGDSASLSTSGSTVLWMMGMTLLWVEEMLVMSVRVS